MHRLLVVATLVLQVRSFGCDLRDLALGQLPSEVSNNLSLTAVGAHQVRHRLIIASAVNKCMHQYWLFRK